MEQGKSIMEPILIKCILVSTRGKMRAIFLQKDNRLNWRISFKLNVKMLKVKDDYNHIRLPHMIRVGLCLFLLSVLSSQVLAVVPLSYSLTFCKITCKLNMN